MKVDYYEMLGVTKGCDEKTLKSAFRKLAMQFHPDKNPGDAASDADFDACFTGAEFREGLAAFAERRRAVFR